MSVAKNLFGGLSANELNSNNRIKLLIFGPPGVGKSYISYQFPSPIVFDTENKAHTNKKALAESGAEIIQTTDIDEIYKIVSILASTKHDKKTIIFDSGTLIYHKLIKDEFEKQKQARQAAAIKWKKSIDEISEDPFAPYRKAKMKLEPLSLLLYNIDMNVVIISHIKNDYSKDHEDTVAAGSKFKLERQGETFDYDPKIAYIFPLVIQVSYKKNRNGERVRVGKVNRYSDASCSRDWQDHKFIFTYKNLVGMSSKMGLIDEESFIADAIPMIVSPTAAAAAMQLSNKVVPISNNQTPVKQLVFTEMTDKTWVTLGEAIGHLNIEQSKIDGWVSHCSHVYNRKITHLQNISEQYALRLLKELNKGISENN